jgi:aerobic-type carbon monoxide dehydrogenase small subunit (CoxS/CutS family)
MLKSARDLAVTVNGVVQRLQDMPADMHLGHYLREILGLTGTRIGCSIGECRACTVMVRQQPGDTPVTKQACMISMRHVNGWEITTVEGLAKAEELHPVQEAILEADAFQCGYCASGFAVAGAVACEQLAADPGQDVAKVVEAVTGHNLCRCTGYARYREAITSVVVKFACSTDKSVCAAPHSGEPLSDSIGDERMRALEYTPLFEDARIELVRLLRNAAEVEHSLLVQYLFAAFSIRVPKYMSLAGWPSHRYGGRPLHLLGVAIEEMLHLDVVNGLLVALGASPHLGRQQFPYEQDIYPFPFQLESLSLATLAKYAFVEGGPSVMDPESQDNDPDRAFAQRLIDIISTIGDASKPNRVGSLYRKIAEVLLQLEARDPSLVDYNYWRARLHEVMIEGEVEHYALFRSLIEGTHPALPGPDVWQEGHPGHPSRPLSVTSGLPRPGEKIAHERLSALRHLANLHYWVVCMLLHQSYERGGRLHNSARRHMTGPMRSVAWALAEVGEGAPFDVLPTGYAPGLSATENIALVRSMLQEVSQAETRFAAFLPHDYPARCALETAQEVAMLVRDSLVK